jgi:hypothetical protein
VRISFVGLNITIFIYKGKSTWEEHALEDLLATIVDVRARRYQHTLSHGLVSDWFGVSLSKEKVAQALRDNKTIMPRSRNVIDDTD